jgi:hypothetical protein
VIAKRSIACAQDAIDRKIIEQAAPEAVASGASFANRKDVVKSGYFNGSERGPVSNR